MMQGHPIERPSNVYQAIRANDAGVTVTITVHEIVESHEVSGIDWPRVAQQCETLLQLFADDEFKIEDDDEDEPTAANGKTMRITAKPRA